MTHDDDRDEDIGEVPQQPANNDDEVGYGKPPKKHWFKPGQSGNPKGRKKGSRGLKTDLRAELRSKVPVTENGKTKQLTKQQLVLKALVTKAAKGDIRAAAQVLSLSMQMHGIEDERVGKSQVSASDAAVLEDYLASIAGSSEPPPDWPAEPTKSSAVDDLGETSEDASNDHLRPDIADGDVNDDPDVEDYGEEYYDDD